MAHHCLDVQGADVGWRNGAILGKRRQHKGIVSSILFALDLLGAGLQQLDCSSSIHQVLRDINSKERK